MKTILCFALLICVYLSGAWAFPSPDGMVVQPEELQADESRWGGWGGYGWGRGGGGWGHGSGWGHGGGWGYGGGWRHGGKWGYHGWGH